MDPSELGRHAVTTITLEHLELAALAAGMTPIGWTEAEDGLWFKFAEYPGTWRPQTDIAEAARLGRVIGARISFESRGEVAASCNHGQHLKLVEHDGSSDDADRAFCECITLLAASVGLKMREIGSPCSDRDEPQRR